MVRAGGFPAGILALILLALPSIHADTFIKLDLGGSGPDLQMNSAGVLSTADDGNAGTLGNQNTSVQFTAFLEPLPDINTNSASVTLNGLAVAGPALTFGDLVIQNFFGGQFSLFDSANALLLQGSINASSLTGTVGPPGTGSVFTTTFGTITGGTLAPLIQPGSLSLSISLTNINGGSGFSLVSGNLAPFLADGSLDLAGQAAVPEPTTSLLIMLATGAAGAWRLRRRE
jgi:hypothetical protein